MVPAARPAIWPRFDRKKERIFEKDKDFSNGQ
jgi:hypothetical protein